MKTDEKAGKKRRKKTENTDTKRREESTYKSKKGNST